MKTAYCRPGNTTKRDNRIKGASNIRFWPRTGPSFSGPVSCRNRKYRRIRGPLNITRLIEIRLTEFVRNARAREKFLRKKMRASSGQAPSPNAPPPPTAGPRPRPITGPPPWAGAAARAVDMTQGERNVGQETVI